MRKIIRPRTFLETRTYRQLFISDGRENASMDVEFSFIFVDAIKKPQENVFHRIRCNCSAMLFSISHPASLSCLQVLERDTDLTGKFGPFTD